MKTTLLATLALLTAGTTSALAEPDQLLWGDTHLHTSNSADAFLSQNKTADPHTAYKYAKGSPVIHPGNRVRVQIGTPLDFLVIADHAEFYGAMRHTVYRGVPTDGLSAWQSVVAAFNERALTFVTEWDYGRQLFAAMLPAPGRTPEEIAADPNDFRLPGAAAMERSMWQEAIRIADEHNEPGHFTALIGWEWSSLPGGANLHRVVFTSADAEVASQWQPFSSVDSMYPEDLWAWLEETTERTGAQFVSIPHNSNISKGRMFPEKNLRGEPYTEESAKTRAKWETVVEATQLKGDSEAHPDLSPNDEFADFELYPYYIEQEPPPYEADRGDYVRTALMRGLAIEEKIGFNPYQFGLIGSTDAHTGVASAEENNFWGKFPRDSIPENKTAAWRKTRGPSGWSMSASGLAAVWAEANTREEILDAFRRREVYATTGPRIAVRVFGGWDFDEADLLGDDLAPAGYARGVPMGGELTDAKDRHAPRFLIQAMRDPKSANLDRIQVIKGWLDASGESQERIYDVVGGGVRDRDENGKLSPVGSTVNLETALYTNDIGSADLTAVWEDPDFDPAQSAFYYVRVLEIPTPRHSLMDAVALGVDPKGIEGASIIQERAYTSPIWYRPDAAG